MLWQRADTRPRFLELSEIARTLLAWRDRLLPGVAVVDVMAASPAVATNLAAPIALPTAPMLVRAHLPADDVARALAGDDVLTLSLTLDLAEDGLVTISGVDAARLIRLLAPGSASAGATTIEV